MVNNLMTPQHQEKFLTGYCNRLNMILLFVQFIFCEIHPKGQSFDLEKLLNFY